MSASNAAKPRRSTERRAAQSPRTPHALSVTNRMSTMVAMLTISWTTVRLFLHVLAATIWVGGQLTLAALVPALRGTGRDVVKLAAQRFNTVAWPAFAVLVATGIWNVVADAGEDHGSFRVTLIVKLAVVLASGVTAFVHARARGTAGLAVFGALTGLSALAALFIGILLSN